MKNLLNKNIEKTEVPALRKFANMLVDFPNVVNLTVGLPDFQTPQHIKDAAKTAIDENHTSYTNHAGLLKLRQAVSDFGRRNYSLNYDPESEIIITNGASEALDITFRTILNEGDEVLLPAPVYPGYEALITLSGGVPVLMDTSGTDFKITPELIEKHITSKTKCLIINNPANPTGAVLNKEDLQKIADILNKKDIFVISDEIYSELVYGENFISYGTIEGVRERTIIINGLSKSHAMTGWRIGFTFAPSYLTEQMLKPHYFNTVCASSISQHAAIQALTAGIDDPKLMKAEYEKRRDYVCQRLTAMGLDVIVPGGAFYVFPNIEQFKINSYEFCMRMINEAEVAVVPGSAFSTLGEGYFRLSYAYSMEHLTEGLNRIETFIKTLSI